MNWLAHQLEKAARNNSTEQVRYLLLKSAMCGLVLMALIVQGSTNRHPSDAQYDHLSEAVMFWSAVAIAVPLFFASIFWTVVYLRTRSRKSTTGPAA